MRLPDRHRQAFQESGNLVGLALAGALSLALLSPLPLLCGVVGEAAYLLFVPDTNWYEKRLAKKHDAEIEKRRRELKEKVMPLLRPDMQGRFTRLEEVRTQIGAQP